MTAPEDVDPRIDDAEFPEPADNYDHDRAQDAYEHGLGW